MRILIVSQYFWPENFIVNDLACSLHRRGHRVEVLTGKPNYGCSRFYPGYGLFKKSKDSYRGIAVRRVPLLPRFSGRGWQLFLNYLSFAAAGSLLAPFYCRGSYDLIFVFQTSPVTAGIPAVVLNKLKGTPIFFWVQDPWPDSLTAVGAVKSPSVLGLVGRLTRYIYKHCARILVQSRRFIPGIERAGIEKEIIYYFPNWVGSDYRPLSLPDTASADMQLPAGFRLVYGGNVGSAQDFETILEAALKLKQYRDIQWIIIGEGRRLSWLQKQVLELGLDKAVHIIGRRPPAEMPCYLAAADVLLVTLKSRPVFEKVIPSKIQAYLACGKPVAGVIDGEGAAIIEESGAGLAGKPGDSDALERNVLKLYRLSRDRRKELGLAGRSYYEKNFSREMLLNNLETWMKEAVQAGRGSEKASGARPERPDYKEEESIKIK